MLNVFLNLVNEFPLFALMLHVKDPFRLPGMPIHIEPLDMTNIAISGRGLSDEDK